MTSIAQRIQRLEERRAQIADRFAERKTLGSLEASIRVMQLCAAADRLDPKTAHGRHAGRVADLMQIALTRYVAHHGHAPRMALPPPPPASEAFDLTAEIERQAQRSEQQQFDRQQHHH